MMGSLRIQRIEIQGFRGFGTSAQSVALPDSVAVLWGGNSQGKTSLAEAIEFLLTGHIARRELLASAKDEFSQSLRNAHIPLATPVFVEATFLCADGVMRRFRRTLTTDYDGNEACVSATELDGTPCAEQDIEAKIGLRLLHPPLRAPVLAQHTLAYVFTASPTDRSAYFRAVLDTQDLEDFRLAVANIIPTFQAPNAAELEKLAAVENIDGLDAAARTVRNAKTKPALEKALSAALEILLTQIGVVAKPSLAERIGQLDDELESRRKLAFPLDLFSRKPLGPWNDAAGTLAKAIPEFVRERDAVSEEVRRLIALFESALAIPAVHACIEPADCPLCGTAKTLSQERVAHIQGQLAANEKYQAAENTLLTALRASDAKLQAIIDTVLQALPQFMQVTGAERRKRGFRIDRIATLSANAEGTKHWIKVARLLWRGGIQHQRALVHTRALIKSALDDITSWQDVPPLVEAFNAVGDGHVAIEAQHSLYGSAVHAISEPLKAAVDRNAQTGGWDALLHLARSPDALLAALSSLREHNAMIKALEQAAREIEKANGAVADEKFSDLSVHVLQWWERLRPGEPTFFSAVQRRGAKTKRTIDLKVALSSKDDRSDVKLRDAVAVLSQSQLHCLGLALFLARAIDGGTGFVLLDDPVLTSDDDFRINFQSCVIESLLNAGLQVIVLTQDYRSWKDIGNLWSHRGAEQFQIMRDNAMAGTEIRGQNDDLAAMLVRAQPFIKSQDGDQRKAGAARLRDAIERFCKELMVKDRRAAGDGKAMITDYDGKNFGEYNGKVYSLLSRDPSHPNKLKVAHSNATPGSHDDAPPSSTLLIHVAGELKRMKKDYLD
jgi:AAA domain